MMRQEMDVKARNLVVMWQGSALEEGEGRGDSSKPSAGGVCL